MSETTPDGVTETPSQTGLKSLCLPENFDWQKLLIRYFLAYREESVLREKIQEKFPEAKVTFLATSGLCSFYAEEGGVLLGYEIS